MSIKSIFGSVFFSVLAALIIYDLVVKGLVAKMGINGYDDTFDRAETFVDEAGQKFIKVA